MGTSNIKEGHVPMVLIQGASATHGSSFKTSSMPKTSTYNKQYAQKNSNNRQRQSAAVYEYTDNNAAIWKRNHNEDHLNDTDYIEE